MAGLVNCKYFVEYSQDVDYSLAMIEQDIRTQILSAAEARFTQYGYGKTTMAEIARDCGMSAANLYRHYENKLDIGAAMAGLFFAEEYRQLAKIVYRDDLTAMEKLEAFTLHSLHHCHKYFTTSPRIIELVEVMSVQSPCVCDDHQQQKIKLLQELLMQAQEKDEFIVNDVPASAEAIHMATLTFRLPMMMPRYTLVELEKGARTLCQMIAMGLQDKNTK
ncbi:MAG: hypothetical protein COB23_02655 [Methylophaga sp.]|nr:MAG: hypothetical protein COB23_02655 [Methylophaga sp.]